MSSFRYYLSKPPYQIITHFFFTTIHFFKHWVLRFVGFFTNMSSEQLLYRQIDVVLATLSSQGVVINNQQDSAIQLRKQSKSQLSSPTREHLGEAGRGRGEEEEAEESTNGGYFGGISSCIGFGPSSVSSHHAPIPKFIAYKCILYVEQKDSTSEGHSDGSDEISITYVTPNHPEYSSKATKVTINTINVQIQNFKPLQPKFNGEAKNLVSHIMNKAYHYPVMQQPRVLVLINPHGGQGKGIKIYNNHIKPILQAARCKITYQETKYSGHATDIARELKLSDYDVVVCCSGDGIPHEVINGLYQRPDKGLEAFNNLIITQLPCGSGNALSLSTLGGSKYPEIATWMMLKSKPSKMDLMAITQKTQDSPSGSTTKLSFLSQCYGIIADSDIGTEHLRWLGAIRFEIGVAQKVLTNATYPCDLHVEFWTRDKAAIAQHVEQHLSQSDNKSKTKPKNNEEAAGIKSTNVAAAHVNGSSSDDFNGTTTTSEDHTSNSFLSQVTQENLQLCYPSLDQPLPLTWQTLPNLTTENLNILYVGKMPYVSLDAQFFPAALPNDGYMDMIVTDTHTTSMLSLTSILLNVEQGKHIDDENVLHAKVKAYRCVPRVSNRNKNHYISVDGESFPFEAFQVEILPGVMTGLLQDGKFTETLLTK